jgi:hypothetical protein
MVSGAPVSPLFSATQPMVFSHSMGMNPFVFPSGIPNHDTQPIPQASNNFSLGMLDMSSHLLSSVSSPYVNPSFGSGGMMPPYSPFSFGGSHIPHTTLTVGGWNLPFYGKFSNPFVSPFLLSAKMVYNLHHLHILFYNCKEEINLKDTPCFLPTISLLCPKSSVKLNRFILQLSITLWDSKQSIPIPMS